MKTTTAISVIVAVTLAVAKPLGISVPGLLDVNIGGSTNTGNTGTPVNTGNIINTGNTGNTGNSLLGVNLLGNFIEIDINNPLSFLNLPPLAIVKLGGQVGNNPVPFAYTSTIDVRAVGSEVYNKLTPAPGPADAVGLFKFGLNGPLNTICYNITLFNVKGAYYSPWLTATHIHEGVRRKDGIPRIVFPNPVGDDKRRNSIGCLTGPFTTGAKLNGVDTGKGFKVSQIEANPAGFFADAHTVQYRHGVVRAQMG